MEGSGGERNPDLWIHLFRREQEELGGLGGGPGKRCVLLPGGHRGAAAMHHLRSTVLRLRPLTAAQAAQSRLAGRDGAPPARFLKTTAAPEPSFSGTSNNYVEEMYAAWLENPGNVHKVE